MKKMALVLVLVLCFSIFPQAGRCGPAILSYLQGQWTIEKIVRSPEGTSKTEIGDPSLENHLVVIEHKAELVLNGKKYMCDLPEPDFIHAKLQEIEVFNPAEKESIDPKNLGLPPKEHSFVLTLKDAPPLEKVILIDRYRESIIFVEGEAYLLKQLPIFPTIFTTTNPHYDLGWTLERDHHYKEALQEFHKTVELEPKNAAAYYSWGMVLEEINMGHEDTQGDSAIEKLQRAVELSPEDENRPINPHSLTPRNGTVKVAAKEMIEEIRIIQKRQRSHDSEM